MICNEAWEIQADLEPLQLLAQAVLDSVAGDKDITVDQLVPICKWYYSYHGAGGWLHIVLDDGNLEDHSVKYCFERAAGEADIVCHLLAGLILCISEDDREVLYEKLHGHKPYGDEDD